VSPLCLSVKQAAASLGVSEWIVRHYVASGLLPTIKLPSTKHEGEDNRRILIAVADLEMFVNKHREVAS
jgi:predicted site-specific integrase-resolvase